MPVKEKVHKIIKEEKTILRIKKNEILKPKSVAPFFGIDKNEVDGLAYQKKVRNEW